MSFAQKDRMDRIQHTFLPTAEKKFHRKRMKNYEIRACFEPQVQGVSFKCPGFVTTISRARKIFFLCGFLLRAIQTTPFCV